MENTTIKIIPGTDGRYLVSSDGRVFNRIGFEKSQLTDKWGYKTVGLRINKIKKRFFVHRLVLSAFAPCDDMDMLQVNHKDENKQNNSLANLEWCTNAYNQTYGTRLKRINPKRRIPIEALDLRGKVIARYASATEAARLFGLCQSNIWAAVNGQRELAYGRRWRRTPMGVQISRRYSLKTTPPERLARCQNFGNLEKLENGIQRPSEGVDGVKSC